MSLKRWLGLDGFDVAIHLAVTGVLLFWIQYVNSTRDWVVFGSMTTAASLIILGIRRRLALSRAEPTGLTTGEMAAERIAELEQRLAELEAVQGQLADMAERLEFAERLLSKTVREPDALARGSS